MSEENKKYHDNVNAKFSEAVYQKMASKRFGLDFCCATDLEKWTRKKELLDLNGIADPENAKVVCPSLESTCSITCLTFKDLCNASYADLLLLLSQGETLLTGQPLIDAIRTVYPVLYADIQKFFYCYVGDTCLINLDNCLSQADIWITRSDTRYDALIAATTNPAVITALNTEKAYAQSIYTAAVADLNTIIALTTTYYTQYTIWEASGYDSASLPDILAETKITYTSCSENVIPMPFQKYITIFRNTDVDVVFSNATFAASTYAGNLDYNAFFQSKFTIKDQKCDCCELPGICEVGKDYLPLPVSNVDFLCDERVFPTEEELHRVKLPEFTTAKDAYDAQNVLFSAYIADHLFKSSTGQPDALPVELPPSPSLAYDPFNKGPQNIGWVDFNWFQGCKCDGFEVEFFQVDDIVDLPSIGEEYQAYYVINEAAHFAWDPVSLTWTSLRFDQQYLPCYQARWNFRLNSLTTLNAFILAMKPFTWSNLHLPQFQIEKYKV